MPPADAPLTRRKRRQCRRAGLRSGTIRRRRAIRRRGLVPAEQRGLPLRYELRRVSRDEFERRYEAVWPRPERPTAAASWERGREAFWQHVMGCYALLSARGQHCRTTNGQRGQALSSRGQPRERRTLQRYSRKLEAMGLASVLHVRRPPGQKDCLALEWRVTRRVRVLHVTPPSGTVNTRLRRGCLPPSRQGVAPPPAADGEPPDKPAERPATREEVIRAELRFVQLKLDSGLGDPEILRLRLARLRAQEAHARRSPEPDGSGLDG